MDTTHSHTRNTPTGGEAIHINISGHFVETTTKVLSRHPSTLLGNAKSRLQFYDPIRREYFIDAHIASFEAIFQFYQTGRLRKPMEVPLLTFIEQMEYFRIGTDVISVFKERQGILPRDEEMPPPEEEGVRSTLWRMSEYPSSSICARRLAIFSVGFVLLSITVLCVETLPQYRGRECLRTLVSSSSGLRYTNKPNFLSEFFMIETVCVAWFTTEVIIRLYSCPSRSRFFHSVLNIIDILSIIPYFITLAMMLSSGNCAVGRKSAAMSAMRILRVFRISKLSKHSSTLRIYKAAMKASSHELLLFLFFLAATSILFAGILYNVEKGSEGTQIHHIPEGIWWAIATITTVGYGDVVPVTRLGKTVGVVCVILGTLTIALPTPIFINNFNKFYKNETGRGFDIEWKPRKKRK